MLVLFLSCSSPETSVLTSREPDSLLVPVDVAGHELLMMVDTGAVLSALMPRGLDALGVAAPADGPALLLETANGLIQAPLLRMPPLSLAGLEHTTATGLLCAHCPEGADGLLGLNLLAHYEMQVDVVAGTVSLTPLAAAPSQHRDIAPWLDIAVRRQPLAGQPGVRITVTNHSPWPVRSLDVRVACLPKTPLTFAALQPDEHRAQQLNTPGGHPCEDDAAAVVDARWQ